MNRLRRKLDEKKKELETALKEIKELKGALHFERNACQYNFDQLEEAQQEIEKYKQSLIEIKNILEDSFSEQDAINNALVYIKREVNTR